MEDAAAGEHGRVHAEPGRAEADAADRLEERADAASLAGPTPAIQQKYACLTREHDEGSVITGLDFDLFGGGLL